MSKYFKGDKLKHVLACLAIYIISFITLYSLDVRGAIGWAILPPLVIGILKEFIDLMGYGSADMEDIRADILGITIGFTLAIFATIFIL